MTSTVRNITFDCAPPYEPYELAQFWSRVVGRPVEDGAAATTGGWCWPTRPATSSA